MVTINCATLQDNLLESELFGHEKGAFTGALQAKAGLIEVAEGSTLFIDEVAEMSPGLQAKLLRVLEDGHFRRVGSTVEGRADVRVIAATNKPLEDEIRAARSREDLYYRLNVLTIALAPLQERRQDIPELVSHFLATRPVGRAHCTIDDEAVQTLTRYPWPGNIRELANVIERAQILSSDGKITLDDLPENLVETGSVKGRPGGDPDHLEEVERRHVQEILQQAGGNKVRAARALGISRRALYRLIAKHHLEPHRQNEEQ
jgi:transcriptional regulator with PAS, ATPase and Fis domain